MMETTLFIAGQGFKSMQEVAQWANELIGKTAPKTTGVTVTRITQFQVVSQDDSLSVLVLAEVEKKSSMSTMVLKMRKDMGLTSSEDN
jgi:hypothetical protein